VYTQDQRRPPPGGDALPLRGMFITAGCTRQLPLDLIEDSRPS